MKLKLTTVFVSATLLCAIAFSGCGTIDRAVTVPAKQPVTENVTNAAGQVYPATYTPLLPNPALQPYQDTGEAIVNVLPEPYKTAGAGVLGLTSLALGWYLRLRNQQLKNKELEVYEQKIAAENAVADSERAKATLRSVIAGVEAADNKAVKQVIAKVAEVQGTQPMLDNLINPPKY